jgi:hypothetical protein
MTTFARVFGLDTVNGDHLGEAVQYRSLDRQLCG